MATWVNYALQLLEDPNATPDPDLPASMEGAKATSFVENAFNYYYARLNDDLIESHRDTFKVTLNENSSGDVALSDVAGAFNDALTQVKSDYAALGTMSDKQLTLVDVSWEDIGSDQVFTVVYNFGWETGQRRINPVFPSGEEWHWSENGGKRVGTNVTLINQRGSPQELSSKIRATIGYGFVTQGIPINVVSHNAPLGPTSILDPTTTTANPWATSPYNAPVASPYRLFSTSSTSSLWLHPVGLNYYRTQIKDMIVAGGTALNKSFKECFVYSTAALGGSVVSYHHYINVEYADMINPYVVSPPLNL